MRAIRIFTAVYLVAVGLTSGAAAQDAGSAEEGSPVNARALVGVGELGRGRAAEAIAAYGGDVVEYYAPGSFFVVDTPRDAVDWSRQVRSDRRVRYAEPDHVVTADVIPNDPRWSELWGMQKIGMPQAWDVHKGSVDVVVGIIDTGVAYNHEDLAVQMWKNPGETPGNGIDDDRNGRVDDVYGNDCRNNDGNPIDDNDHGTHVAGTIGAAANNGKGVVGVNWNVRIMALKFLSSSGSGYTSDAVECLDYAIAKGAALTNNSWGGGGYSQAMLDAIGRAQAADQLFVAAAGNSGSNNDSTPHYPSSYAAANVVSVASTTSSDSLSSFSNYGATSVDIAAPGSSILSTLRSGYGTKSGTSMATPHVAGAAALLIAQNPSWTYTQVRDRLYATVTPLSSLSGKVATGGRLNVSAAVGWVPAPTPSESPTGTPITTDSVHMGDLDNTSYKSSSTWRGRIVVKVHNAAEGVVSGATVTGVWSNGYSGSGSCVTGSSGTCSVTSGSISKWVYSVTFTVTGVTHPSGPYNSGANHDPDSDSNGTTITAPRPW